jgi:curved DNA-binding protein CbpA
MSAEDYPLPDYYAILQVHSEAEYEVIRVAYRTLMRKYHPYNLSAEQQQDLELLKRVRSINIAYDVLSDPTQRAAYDLALKRQSEEPSVLSTPGVDTRIHLVRCAKMGITYKMLLARRTGSLELFCVTGFELIEDNNSAQLSNNIDGWRLLLSDGQEKSKSLSNLLKRVLPASKKRSSFSNPPPKFPNQNELRDMFAASDSLNFGEIDWGGHKCPACHADFQSTTGYISTWCRCSSCSRIYCAGNIHNTPFGDFSHCPWCGRMAKITRHIKPGEKVNMPVYGVVRSSEGESHKVLKGTAGKQLPDTNKG